MPLVLAPDVIQTAYAEIASDTTTTSVSFVDLLTISLLTNGGDVLIEFDVSGTNSGSYMTYYRITFNGVSCRGASYFSYNSAVAGAAICVRLTGVAADSVAHTIKVQWCVGDGTARIRPVAAADVEHASLWVAEVTV